MSVNVAALPPTLFESELFGHVKGAFTGAVAAHAGRFDLAADGTLFLDEIGELSSDLQAKLLSVAETGEVWAVGARSAKRVDVRLVAATNRDPATLRPDLVGRFLHTLRLPSLVERGDVLELAAEWLPQASAEVGRDLSLSRESLAWMRRYGWPGNVRELHHAIVTAGALAALDCRRAVVEIGVADLQLAVGADAAPSSPATAPAFLAPARPLAEAAAELTRRRQWWSVAELAEAAGCSASTARRWCVEHGRHNGAPTRGRLWSTVHSSPIPTLLCWGRG